MAAIIRLKRRMYTQWDETDNLKRMRDSDILAEKQRQTTDYGAIARGAAAGTVAAGTAGAVFGAGKGVFNPGSVGAASRVSGLGKGISKYGKLGMAGGALIGAGIAYSKGRKQAEENERLKHMVEDMKVINRAKLLLVTCLNMSEEQAHRYLEKQAMDLRVSKLQIAMQVIKTYEN